jgi:hypothetical protein
MMGTMEVEMILFLVHGLWHLAISQSKLSLSGLPSDEHDMLSTGTLAMFCRQRERQRPSKLSGQFLQGIVSAPVWDLSELLPITVPTVKC